jgi:NAD(P)H-hydrate repair Nnr-like enzyme with NAD(P)H-hydrate dehydratase domain
VPDICSTGNPGMATGGMGDVLAGVVGALLGQGHEAGIAALGGTLVHAAAGDRAWRDQGIGLTATDVIGYLGSVLTPELVDTQ